MTVKDYFEELEKASDGKLKVESSRWFNGHTYFPFSVYRLNLPFEGYNIQIEYEYKQSEFSKSSVIDGGAFKGRNTCGVECFIHSVNFPNLEIREAGFLAKIRNKPAFKIKTKNEAFKVYLSKLKELEDIFLLATESSDFSPQIIGKNNSGIYCLSIRFSSVGFKKDALNLILSLCDQVSLYSNQEEKA